MPRGKFTSADADFVTIQYQGLNLLQEDIWAISQIIQAGAGPVLELSAEIGVGYAKEFVPVDTGATRDSISIQAPGLMSTPSIGIWSIRYGAETVYAPYLEYGTSEAFPRPFLIPSADLAGAVLADTVYALVGAAMGFSTGGIGLASDPRVGSSITKFRTSLYSTSKFLGDISIFGGRQFLGPTRRSLLSVARGLGDIQATMKGTVGARVTHRIGGTVVGRLSGFGSHSLTAHRTYSGFAGGTAGHRVYSRVAGRYGATSLSQLASAF